MLICLDTPWVYIQTTRIRSIFTPRGGCACLFKTARMMLVCRDTNLGVHVNDQNISHFFTPTGCTVQLSAVQSLDRLGRRGWGVGGGGGDVRDQLAETTEAPIVQGALMDGFGEADVTLDNPNHASLRLLTVAPPPFTSLLKRTYSFKIARNIAMFIYKHPLCADASNQSAVCVSSSLVARAQKLKANKTAGLFSVSRHALAVGSDLHAGIRQSEVRRTR